MPRPVATPRTSVVKMIWHVFPRDGPSGALKDIDYWVERGCHQALGCNDIVSFRPHVAPDQVVVQAAEDGSCVYVYAQGQGPTGWRTSPYEPWTWMQPGESVALATGNKVSLDYNDPEAAVFKFEKNDPSARPGFGQQGGGQLPPGWISGVDQGSGQTYYYNQQTGQSSWEMPTQ